MDVRIRDLPAATRLETQRAVYRTLVSVCVAEPRCDAVTFWGFTDAHSWIDAQFGADDPLLFDDNYAAKPAYYGVFDALLRGDSYRSWATGTHWIQSHRGTQINTGEKWPPISNQQSTISNSETPDAISNQQSNIGHVPDARRDRLLRVPRGRRGRVADTVTDRGSRTGDHDRRNASRRSTAPRRSSAAAIPASLIKEPVSGVTLNPPRWNAAAERDTRHTAWLTAPWRQSISRATPNRSTSA